MGLRCAANCARQARGKDGTVECEMEDVSQIEMTKISRSKTAEVDRYKEERDDDGARQRNRTRRRFVTSFE